MIGICTLPLVYLNCNLWWINVYHVCRQVTRHTAHLHDGSLPGRKIGGGAGRGVWCRNCRCRSDISEKWYFCILDLWNCDGERDMIWYTFTFFNFLFYVISVVDNVEHHSFLQHLFAGCYGVPLLLFQFQTGHWLRLWRETWVKQRLRLRCHGMSWMSGACGSSTSSEMLWRFGLQRPLNLGPVCINYPLVI